MSHLHLHDTSAGTTVLLLLLILKYWFIRGWGNDTRIRPSTGLNISTSPACAFVYFLTCPVIGLVAGVRDFGSELQVVSGLVVGWAVSTQCKHASGKAGQVAHLPLQVAILPLANECQATVGFTYEMAFDGLGEQSMRMWGNSNRSMAKSWHFREDEVPESGA